MTLDAAGDIAVVLIFVFLLGGRQRRNKKHAKEHSAIKGGRGIVEPIFLIQPAQQVREEQMKKNEDMKKR